MVARQETSPANRADPPQRPGNNRSVQIWRRNCWEIWWPVLISSEQNKVDCVRL